VDHDITIGYDNFTADEILRAALPDDMEVIHDHYRIANL
jgi:hypothetical protein